MLKRTKGRLLLTLLVVTGFAGTINNTAPTNQERKFAIEQIKNSKTEIIRTIRGLSETQLAYKPSRDAWNIKEYFFQLASMESQLWGQLETAMKQPSQPEKRSLLRYSDDDLLQNNHDLIPRLQSDHSASAWKSVNEAIAAFRLLKTAQLKYIKTTTSDLRNHFVELPIGLVDCYQVILLITACNNQYSLQIDNLMNAGSFPNN